MSSDREVAQLVLLGSTGSGKTTLKHFLSGNITYRATHRTRVCDVREAPIRFSLSALQVEEANKLNSQNRTFIPEQFRLEWEEEGCPQCNERDEKEWSNFISRISNAAARACRIYDSGGEYAYQSLLPHLPFHDEKTLFVVCISLEADVDKHVSLWFDAIARLRVVDPRVLFVATKGHGTLAEMKRFHRRVAQTLERRQCAFRYAYRIATLVMRNNQKCFMQQYYLTDDLLSQVQKDVASTPASVGDDAIAHALRTVSDFVSFQAAAESDATPPQQGCPNQSSLSARSTAVPLSGQRLFPVKFVAVFRGLHRRKCC